MLPIYNYDPSVYCFFINDSPLPIGGGIIYVLICSLTDPESEQAIADCQLCVTSPVLHLDDGRGWVSVQGPALG